jgi:hypothetical protein
MTDAVADQPLRTDIWPLYSKKGLLNEDMLSINSRDRSVFLRNKMVDSIDDAINELSYII